MVTNFSQISVTEFKQELETKNYTLIDCRTTEEQTIYGIISPDQMLINVNDATAGVQIQKLEKHTPYLVYCWHGNRSKMLRDFMKSQGFETVMDLAGGIDAWNKSMNQK
jgi:rhodanese-related sulfurtransferase